MASTYDDYGHKMFQAAFGGNVEELKKIREEIGEKKFRSMCNTIKTKGILLIHVAVVKGLLEVCKFLVEEVKINIDVKTTEGSTPFLLAVMKDKTEIAKYLIKRGANVKMGNHFGFSPLHCAIKKGNLVLVKILVLYKGADVEADSATGRPLHCAAIYGRPDIIQFLLKWNAKPNTVSKFYGRSPLMSAIKSITNTVECVELLLKAGADPDMLAFGLSPLAYALEEKVNCCIGPLLAAGADVDIVSSRDMRPIEHAADVNNLEGIWFLLHARPWILATRKWKFRVMMRNIRSSGSKEKRDLYVKLLKQKADDLLDNRYQYYSAMEVYDEALYYKPNDEKLFANRSLCRLRLGEGLLAYEAADTCVKLKPKWDKGYFRKANALSQMREYRESVIAFISGFKLNPENCAVEVKDDIDGFVLKCCSTGDMHTHL